MTNYLKSDESDWTVDENGNGKAFYKLGNLIFDCRIYNGSWDTVEIMVISDMKPLSLNGDELNGWYAEDILAQIADGNVNEFARKFPAFYIDEEVKNTVDIFNDFFHDYEIECGKTYADDSEHSTLNKVMTGCW